MPNSTMSNATTPRNLIASKEYFFFGTDAVEPKTLSSYQRSEKSAETAQSNIAWASHTGKGLLFVGDKKAPSSIINLVSLHISWRICCSTRKAGLI